MHIVFLMCYTCPYAYSRFVVPQQDPHLLPHNRPDSTNKLSTVSDQDNTIVNNLVGVDLVMWRAEGGKRM